jgi:hypothetical protein
VGQANVEFALVVGIFLLLVLATLDLARAYLAYSVAANAAREAARYGAAHLGEPDWQTGSIQAGRNVAVGVDASTLTLVPAETSIGGLPYVQVTGSYAFHAVTPLVWPLLGDPIVFQVSTAAPAG